MNTIGRYFRLTSFGESHGVAIGGVIDGCPAGLKLDLEQVQYELNRRRPGQSKLTTPRDEKDQIQIQSGIFEGETTGTPIGFAIYNKDQHSSDYGNLKGVFRPSHADYTYWNKYGTRDHRGGGRSSARETIARVAAGAVAKQLIATENIKVNAYVSQVGDVELKKSYSEVDLSLIDSNLVRCPDAATAELMEQKILDVAKEGDTIGGVITGVISGVPVGLGEPVFNKLHADLGFAMLGINAVKGFEYGSGFEGTSLRGSEHNDEFEKIDGEVITKTNHSGGIQGGISNGMDIYFKVAFKPIATIFKDQDTVDKSGEKAIVNPKGRHDACVLPRAVPIVEAMAALVMADHLLGHRLSKI
ncbi:chorismate synthase [Prolixibacteraceae bacterium JC049]|nr:chorismate synthase [Prolixibacteraceae bacterium JC049]